MNGAQVQTLRNIVVYGDRITLGQGPDGTVIAEWPDLGKQAVLDQWGGFAWRYV